MLFRNILTVSLKHLHILACFLLSLCSALGQKGVTPENINLYQTYGTGSPGCCISVSWVNISKLKDQGFIYPGMAILNSNGDLVWYSLQPGWFQANDFRSGKFPGTWSVIRVDHPDSMEYLLLDNQFEIVSRLKNGIGTLPDAHEFYPFSPSTWLLSGRRDILMQPGDSIPVRCFVLEEMDVYGNVVWKWNCCEYLSPEEGYDSYPQHTTLHDCFHGNTAFRANDSLLIISMRNMNAILGIRYPEGTLAWRLCGEHSDFNFGSDPGFSGQHDYKDGGWQHDQLIG